MPKPYYADYINHAIRQYVQKPIADSGDYIDVRNRYVVKTVLLGLTIEEKDAILEVYRRRDTMEDNVYSVARERKIDQDKIWTMLSRVTKMIAKELKLI